MNLAVKRVDGLEDPLYQQAKALFELAFPAYQRRGGKDQALAFALPEYRLEVWLAADRLAAAMSWWDFPEMRYVEFLAVSPDLRSSGIGGKLLRTWLASSDKLAVLEIDPVARDAPADDPSRRRLRFYRRLDFKENAFRHGLPSYVDNSGYHPAQVLTWPRALSEDEFASFNQHLREAVLTTVGRGRD